MMLIDKTTRVPALIEPDERDAGGALTNAVLAQFGRAAVDVGTPDRGLDDERNDAVDTLANILFWLHENDVDPFAALESAARYFSAEVAPETVEARAARILTEAGIDAHVEHTGGGNWVCEASSTTFPGRPVWVTDSEGDEAGAFLVGVYPDTDGQGWFEALSGACSEAELVAKVRAGLSSEVDEER